MRQTGGSESIRNLLVQLLSEMQPEILARRVQLDLDLDEVKMERTGDSQSVKGASSNVVTAIRGLLADAIESTDYEGELSVTLIDADSSWELELATSTRNDGKIEVKTNGPSPEPHSFPELDRLAAGWRGKNFTLSSDAANQCGGQIQVLDCPQGGAARVLVMPKRQLRRGA